MPRVMITRPAGHRVVASRLRGKHKPAFTPFLDTGDHVVDASTRKRSSPHRQEAADQKLYRRHSGYPGGLREINAADMLAEKHPERLVAVCREGHAAQGAAGPQDVSQAQGVPRERRTSPPGPEPPGRSRSADAAPWPSSTSSRTRRFDRTNRIVATKSSSTTAPARRKSSTARVYLRPGSGKFDRERSFVRRVLHQRHALKMVIRQPLVITETATSSTCSFASAAADSPGQAGALRHGIARALIEYNPELRPKLKEAGFLTRDSRKVERKKYGQPGARKRFQFSKR